MAPLPFILAWLSFGFLVVSSSLYVLNVVQEMQDDNRVKVHCYTGFATLLSLLAHFLVTIEDFRMDSTGGMALALIFLIVGTGMVLMYLPDLGELRFHSRSIHPALVIALYFSLGFHVWSTLFWN